jgi:WhiB family transcriptional regulator, redox-sensing transcriptional regulator
VAEWMMDAACRGRHDVDWDSDTVGDDAAAICRGCPVAGACLRDALDREDKCDVGVWAGTGPRERARIRKREGRRYGR